MWRSPFRGFRRPWRWSSGADLERGQSPLVSVRTVLQNGDPAPDFDLLDQGENHVKLSDLRGRKVLVYFYPK
jgi:hypothetical protein